MGCSLATNQKAQSATRQRSLSNSRAQLHSRRNSSPAAGLQRSIGNRALNNLLVSHAVQPKLTVGQPDDEYEREADRVADQVMRMAEPRPNGAAQRVAPVVQRVCKECEEKLQRQVETNTERGRCDECIELNGPVVQTKSSGSD